MIRILEVVTCTLLAGVSDGRKWCRERNNLQKGDVIFQGEECSGRDGRMDGVRKRRRERMVSFVRLLMC